MVQSEDAVGWNQHHPDQTMIALEYFEVKSDCAYFRPVGKFSLNEMIDLISQAITLSCDQSATRLLIDGTRATGYEMPNLLGQYSIIERLVGDLKKPIKIAVVDRQERVAPERFIAGIGRDRGIWCNLFSSIPEAILWLNEAEIP
jgi:hypothetical protein